MKDSKKRTIIIYKIDKKVTIRKPRIKDTYIPFVVDIDDPKITETRKADSISLAKAKTFVKHVITDIKELNSLKNDIGFLMSDLYGSEHSTAIDINVYEGKIFYVWVYIPPPKTLGSSSSQSTLPKSVTKDIYVFDLFYIRRKLSGFECSNIINIFKRDLDTSLHVRNLNEEISIPFNISVSIL